MREGEWEWMKARRGLKSLLYRHEEDKLKGKIERNDYLGAVPAMCH
jgi:hypothetical protein